MTVAGLSSHMHPATGITFKPNISLKEKTMKKRILIICTHNAGRSQMAEGYINTRYGDRWEAYSAGSEPSSLNPYAVRAMKEIEVDISCHQPKNISSFTGEEMDILITVCEGNCPFFPWAKEVIHQGFPDPSLLSGTDDEIMSGTRRIRDLMTAWIDERFGSP